MEVKQGSDLNLDIQARQHGVRIWRIRDKFQNLCGAFDFDHFFTMMALIFLVIIIYVLFPYVCIYVFKSF